MSREEKKAEKRKRVDKKRRKDTAIHNSFIATIQSTSKLLIWFFSINGVLWIWCSYVLAFIGKDQIAESLSSNVCTVVLGQLGFFLISKTIENVFKYNENGWLGKSLKKSNNIEPSFNEPEFTIMEENNNGTTID